MRAQCYGQKPLASGVVGEEVEINSRYGQTSHLVEVWGWFGAPSAATVTIDGINTGDVIRSGASLACFGLGLDTVTTADLWDGADSYPLAITSQSEGSIGFTPVDLLDTPFPIGPITFRVFSPLNDATRQATLAYLAGYQAETVAGGADYLLSGLTYADGDQVGAEVNVAGSNLTLTPDSDVVYTPALPHGTEHSRLHYDSALKQWGSGVVTGNRPAAGDGPPVWRATPAPPPAVKGRPYAYAIGSLLDGERPMTLTDVGVPLPSGLVYGFMPAPDETIEAIVGTPDSDGDAVGIVTKAENSV